MSITIFTTWTTYGTWLSGDARGWFKRTVGLQMPDHDLEVRTENMMVEAALLLNPQQRKIVEQVISDHCQHQKWELHAVNCRSNHIHVVVSTPEIPIQRPREQFKMWATRRLKPSEPKRQYWWTRRGWDVYINDQKHLNDVIRYVHEGQSI